MKTREMTDKLQDWQRRATDVARNFGETTDQYVRDNTWTSLACAAVIGCVIGYLLAGDRDLHSLGSRTASADVRDGGYRANGSKGLLAGCVSRAPASLGNKELLRVSEGKSNQWDFLGRQPILAKDTT